MDIDSHGSVRPEGPKIEADEGRQRGNWGGSSELWVWGSAVNYPIAVSGAERGRKRILRIEEPIKWLRPRGQKDTFAPVFFIGGIAPSPLGIDATVCILPVRLRLC